ncbi:MAG: 4Fe-4S binding protein, partial [Clostridia bacterium]|nr:4Fe-4S binding protein [Clostridia bacterium]
MESKHKYTEIRVPIEEDNPSICRIEEKCQKCGLCNLACKEKMSVCGYYDLKKTNDKAICVNCGQCVNACPFGSIVEKSCIKEVEDALGDSEKVVVFSIAPAVRVALGEHFKLPAGTNLERKIPAICKKIGANYCFDITFGADLTIMEEANELVQRIKSGKNLPQFTSCCPAWVKFVETFYPQNLNLLSTCKSPIAMMGATIKSYFAQKANLNPKQIVNVVVAPCTAKKMEIQRPELCDAGKLIGDESIRDYDYCLTTREFAKMIKDREINLEELQEQGFDDLFSRGSGAGVIFGATGGVAKAALRTAYYILENKNPPEDFLQYKEMHNLKGVKAAEVEIGGKTISVCIVNGLANVRKLFEDINNNKVHYDFIEVMACPGGCSGGGGQPKPTIYTQEELSAIRFNSLLQADAIDKVRFCH